MTDDQFVERLALCLFLQFPVEIDEIANTCGFLQFVGGDRRFRTIDHPEVGLQLAFHFCDFFQRINFAVG